MPRIGIPNSKIFSLHLGAFCSYTEFGPPLKIIPLGLIFIIYLIEIQLLTTREKTLVSLILLAINSEYWDPKSKINIEGSRSFLKIFDSCLKVSSIYLQKHNQSKINLLENKKYNYFP